MVLPMMDFPANGFQSVSLVYEVTNLQNFISNSNQNLSFFDYLNDAHIRNIKYECFMTGSH